MGYLYSKLEYAEFEDSTTLRRAFRAHLELVARLRQINDDHAFMNINLCRSQTNTGCSRHSFSHVFD